MPDPLYPDLDPDEWLELYRKIEEEDEAPLVENHQFPIGQPRRMGACWLSLFYEVTVILHKDLDGNRGQTDVTEVAIKNGYVMDPAGLQNPDAMRCRTDVIVRIQIDINLDSVGKKSEEQNDRVREERENATPRKRAKFDKLPLEFTLIHEEEHVRDIVEALQETLWQSIRCGMAGGEALAKAVNREKTRLIEEAGHGNPNSPGEEAVRRRTWAEWERRHPEWH
jgi:hypothetical protein